MKKINLVILGPQGSGKGTQAEILAKKYHLACLGAGDLIRDFILKKTKEAKRIKKLYDKGQLIPDPLVKELFKRALSKIGKKKGLIFEGYPRTLKQFSDFLDLLKKREIKDFKVIFLNIKKETALKRLSGRRICSNCQKIYYPPKSLSKRCPECQGKLITRPDDKKEVILNRLSLYLKETKPLVDYLRKREGLFEIDAEPPIKEVFKEIIKKLSND